MRTEAKPCPFCGGSDIGVFEGGTFRWMSAECRGCGAQTSEVRVQTSGSGNRDEWKANAQARAIEEWNKRAEATPTPAASRAATPSEMREALRLAREYVRTASVSYYDGTNGEGMRAEAARRLKIIDAALAAPEAAQPASPAPLTREQDFHDWFAANYSGEVVFSDPRWHSEKILRWARRALASPQVAPEGAREALEIIRNYAEATIKTRSRDFADWQDDVQYIADCASKALAAPVQVAPEIDPRGADYRKGFGISSTSWEQDGWKVEVKCTDEGIFLPAIELSMTRIQDDAAPVQVAPTQAAEEFGVKAVDLTLLADEWEDTAAMAEKHCVGDDLFQGEARGLRSAAKELRAYVESGALPEPTQGEQA